MARLILVLDTVLEQGVGNDLFSVRRHSQFARDKGKERGDVRTLRFGLIDEYQDFSEMFYRLVAGVRSLNPSVEFFCVGDDWQAINGFAGSDLKYFQDSQLLQICHHGKRRPLS